LLLSLYNVRLLYIKLKSYTIQYNNNNITELDQAKFSHINRSDLIRNGASISRPEIIRANNGNAERTLMAVSIARLFRCDSALCDSLRHDNSCRYVEI